MVSSELCLAEIGEQEKRLMVSNETMVKGKWWYCKEQNKIKLMGNLKKKIASSIPFP